MSPTATTGWGIPVHFRDPCVSELIDTEHNYVQALDLIINSFAKPLEGLLTRSDNQLLFGHIKYFHRIHSNFLADLIKAASTTTVSQDMKLSTPKISSCFLHMKDKFLKYSDYCAALSKSQNLLEELAAKPNDVFSPHLEQCQQSTGFKLTNLLSLPVQRILKYHLLLGQLIKKTSDDDEGLRRAYEAMVDLPQYINEVKRDTEAIAIINEIQQSISGPDMPLKLIECGRLVEDGFIRIGTPKQKKYVFIFDQVLLICEINGLKRYHLIETVPLADYVIEPHIASSDNKETFQLVRIDKGAVYSFFTKTLEEKNKWMESLQRAINNVRPPLIQGHNFVMHTFSKASSCDHCGKLLHGLYFQGYKCTLCSTSAHKKCLPSIQPCEPPRNSTNESQLALEDYSGQGLDGYPWFCGRMSRDEAHNLLLGRLSGTFLVRISPHNGGYVISLNYNNTIKHMKIHMTKEYRLYLSQNRYFGSVVELVAWYEKNSLVESFHMLDAYLTIPFKECC